jgi:hypothetical protein
VKNSDKLHVHLCFGFTVDIFSQRSTCKGLVPKVIVFRDALDPSRWSLMGGPEVTGDMSLERIMVSSSGLSLLPES